MRTIVAAAVLVCTWSAELHGAQVVEHPFLGITHITRTETFPRVVRMHVVQIDLAAPGIQFELTPAGGTLEAVRQTTLDFLDETQAQVAINGNYFLPFPSTSPDAMLVGLAVSNGNVYSAFEWPLQAYAIVKDAPALNIDPWNYAAIVHRDVDFADGMHVLEDVTLWNALGGSAQIVTNGVKTIPTYVDAQNPEGLLTPGGPGNYSNGNSWYDLINARSAIGLTEDAGTLILFTVDRAGGSLGMSVGEVADVLVRDYGVYDALNLDGGGSTTLAMENPITHVRSIVNASADNAAGRSVGSNLAIFADPDTSGPSSSTSSTSSSTSTTTSSSTTTTIATTSTTTSSSTSTTSPPQILQIPVQGGSNDAEESASGSVNLTSTDLELVQDLTVQKVGMRFIGVGIPRGATIDLAYVQFQVDETGSGTTNLTVTGQNVGNAPAFGTNAGNISSRLRTSAVAWANVPSWPTVGARGAAQRTADLKAIVQQIVNLGGWASGNAIVIIIEGTGKRVAASYEIGQSAAPTLVVQFRASGVTTTTSSTTTTLAPATTTTTTRPPATISTTSTTTSSTTTLPAGGSTTSVYQAAVSGPVGSANVDTYIRLSSPTTNYGSDLNLYVGVTNGADKVYRSILGFNLSGIPAGAVVTSCRLTVNVTQRTSPTPGRIRRLCAEHWLDGDGLGEAQATWSSWKTGSAWGAAGASSTASCAAGGDTSTAGEVAYVPPGGTGLFAFPDLSALCRDALAQRGGRLRLRISQDAETTQSNLVKFDSSDASTAANRPKLTVTWFPPSP